MKKLSKVQKRKKKEEFLESYASIIIEKYYPKAKLYPHFIKIEIDGVECDYYPGAERINRIKGKTNEWSDLSHKDFLAHLQIDLNEKNFSSREEVLLLKHLGIDNVDV